MSGRLINGGHTAQQYRADCECYNCTRSLRRGVPSVVPAAGRPPTDAEKNWSGDGPLDLVTPAPPHPATDPHEGWTPLVAGCAMPEMGDVVNVTIDDGEGNAWVESCVFREVVGFDCDLEWGERVTAWRPAPAPYRGRS